MKSSRAPHLIRGLELAYRDFHQDYRRQRDPVQFAHRFSDPADQEVVAFFCALIAYGNVSGILANGERILAALGSRPRITLKQGRFGCPGFVHRWTTETDLKILALRVREVLEEYGSLEQAFCRKPAGTRERMEDFVDLLESVPLPRSLRNASQKRSRNLKYLLPHPARGSACKRMNLFLRWMVRPNDGVDLGLWKRIHPRELYLPLDVHLMRTVQTLGWTTSRQANWKVVEQVTRQLSHLSPEDPIRYDFALCHLSMTGQSLSKYVTAGYGGKHATLE